MRAAWLCQCWPVMLTESHSLTCKLRCAACTACELVAVVICRCCGRAGMHSSSGVHALKGLALPRASHSGKTAWQACGSAGPLSAGCCEKPVTVHTPPLDCQFLCATAPLPYSYCMPFCLQVWACYQKRFVLPAVDGVPQPLDSLLHDNADVAITNDESGVPLYQVCRACKTT